MFEKTPNFLNGEKVLAFLGKGFFFFLRFAKEQGKLCVLDGQWHASLNNKPESFSPTVCFVPPWTKPVHVGSASLPIPLFREHHPDTVRMDRDASEGWRGQFLKSVWFSKALSGETGRKGNYPNGMEEELVKEHLTSNESIASRLILFSHMTGFCRERTMGEDSPLWQATD